MAMNAKDITGRDSFDDWLEERPEEVRRSDAIAIAQRAALRVLPVWLAEVERSRSREGAYTALPVLRSLLTSGVGHGYSPAHGRSQVNVGDAAVSAGYAAIAALQVADAACADAADPDAYAEAADAVRYAVAAASLCAGDSASDAAGFAAVEAAAEALETAAWGAVRTDAEAVEGGRDPRTLPLWSKDPPPVISLAELAGLETLATETGDPNSFWHRWWFAMKRGEPMDWELLRNVALIPDKIWKQGQKSVLETIARL
jgi:hypothetical protein